MYIVLHHTCQKLHMRAVELMISLNDIISTEPAFSMTSGRVKKTRYSETR